MFCTNDAVLLVIDIQGKLAKVVDEAGSLHQTACQLISTAQLLEIPIIFTEQVPEKLGTTTPEILGGVNNPQVIHKSSFSCWGEKGFQSALSRLNRKQVIVCGIEAHVCVMQTVNDLMTNKYNVQVVSDGVSSRKLTDKNAALGRMERIGADVTTSEMIITELLETSTHKKFKDIMKLIK